MPMLQTWLVELNETLRNDDGKIKRNKETEYLSLAGLFPHAPHKQIRKVYRKALSYDKKGAHMIIVANKKTFNRNDYPDAYIKYVGRPSLLQNPYKIGRIHGDRAQVIEMFRQDLNKHRLAKDEVWDEIEELVKIHFAGIPIVLVCWCAPKPCHADVIKAAIEWRMKSYVESENKDFAAILKDGNDSTVEIKEKIIEALTQGDVDADEIRRGLAYYQTLFQWFREHGSQDNHIREEVERYEKIIEEFNKYVSVSWTGYRQFLLQTEFKGTFHKFLENYDKNNAEGIAEYVAYQLNKIKTYERDDWKKRR